jgi:hypothetical protein
MTKEVLYQGLSELPVIIEDTSKNSLDYFRINNLPTELTAGKNLFSFSGNPYTFVEGSPLYVEVVDSTGTPIYTEVSINAESDDQYAIVSIFIDDIIAPGSGEIILCGTVDTDANGNPIDTSMGVNIRWSTPIQIYPSKRNTSNIVFSKLPIVAVSASKQSYVDYFYPGNGNRFTSSLYSGLNYLLYNNSPVLLTSSLSTAFTSDIVSGTIYISSSNIQNIIPNTTNIVTVLSESIVSVINSGSIVLANPLEILQYNSNAVNEFKSATIASANIVYEQQPNSSSFSSKYYNLITVNFSELEPTAGTVSRIKSYYKQTSVGEYVLFNESDISSFEPTYGYTTSSLTLRLPLYDIIRDSDTDFKFEFINPDGTPSNQVVVSKNHLTYDTCCSSGFSAGVTQIIAGTNITISPVGGTGIVTINAGTPVSASYALSSSYAANGGVTQLLAGANISLSPSNGLGQVTITSTGGSGGTGNTATGSYGSFYSTQTQTNVAGTARSMSLNVTDITNGVSISGSTNPFNTYIKVQNPGVYDIQFSAQVDKTDSGTDEIWIWIRKNGTDISDSATSLQLVGNGAHYVAAWNFFVNAAANDYFQLMWYSTDANVRLHAESAFGVVPGIPSLIVTANRVDQFLSNTGSFSGSFIGSLFGTASWAQNAVSASYAPDTTFPYYGNARISGSLTVTGSVTVSGSSTFTNIGPAIFSGSVISVSGFTGSLAGTASYATDFNRQGLLTTGSFGTTQTISGSLTLGNTNASANDNITITGTTTGGGVAFISASKFLKISSGLDLTLESTSGIYANGTLEVTGGITGSLQGTATFATDHATKVSTLFVQGYLTGNQSIPNNADTVINFERQYDPNLWLDLGTRRFTPTVAGYYSVSIGAWLENPASPTNQVNVQVRKSTGGGPTGTVMILQQPLNNGTGISLAGTRIFYMDGGTDYLDFTIFQGSGGAKNLLYGGTADGAGTWFSAHLLTM